MLLGPFQGAALYQQIGMSWKLRINDKIDPKLAEHFPNDPYSDIIICTATQQLNLTLAYLSIDSGYFSQIDPSTACLHLKHLPEGALLAVLRALYGGQLVATSFGQLDQLLQVIEYLAIDEYKQNLQLGLVQLQEAKGEQSPLNSIEMLQFCLSRNIVKEFICQVYYSNHLKALQSSKNYLQLGKLSAANLNYLLLNYLSKEPNKARKTVNTILENYFNRKSIRPADYLDQQELAPLKQVWEEFHHKIPAKVSRPLTKTYPMTNNRMSAFLQSAHSPEKQQYKKRMQKLSAMPSFNIQSINLGLAVLQSHNASEEELLDLRLRMLAKESESKSRTVRELQEEMRELETKLEEKRERQLGELEDITLLQNIARSKRSKESQIAFDSSLSTNENAFQLVRRQSDTLCLEKCKSACRLTAFFLKKESTNTT